jgi:hypothetical protein
VQRGHCRQWRTDALLLPVVGARPPAGPIPSAPRPIRDRVPASASGPRRSGHTVSVGARSVHLPKHSGSRATGSIRRPSSDRRLAGAVAGPPRSGAERAAELRPPSRAPEAGAAGRRTAAVVEEVAPRPIAGEAGPHTAEEDSARRGLRAMGVRAPRRVVEVEGQGSRIEEEEEARQLAVEGAEARRRGVARRSSSSRPTLRRRRVMLRDRSFGPWIALPSVESNGPYYVGRPYRGCASQWLSDEGQTQPDGGRKMPAESVV